MVIAGRVEMKLLGGPEGICRCRSREIPCPPGTYEDSLGYARAYQGGFSLSHQCRSEDTRACLLSSSFLSRPYLHPTLLSHRHYTVNRSQMALHGTKPPKCTSFVKIPISRVNHLSSSSAWGLTVSADNRLRAATGIVDNFLPFGRWKRLLRMFFARLSNAYLPRMKHYLVERKQKLVSEDTAYE